MNTYAENSRPYLEHMDVRAIDWQYRLVEFINNYDYKNLPVPEILLCGSYYSAKTIIATHIGLKQLVNFPGARICLGRRALPDIKSTIFQEFKDHLSYEDCFLEEDVDYKWNDTTASLYFKRKRGDSELISKSWADKKYEKMRGLKITAAIIEELTENSDEEKEAYLKLVARVNRQDGFKTSNGVPNFVIALTNPDEPTHWVYDRWFVNPPKNRVVFNSVVSDNPFADPNYVDSLAGSLDPLAFRRYVHNEWISLTKEIVYYSYSRKRNFKEESYAPRKGQPIWLSWDFNIGKGKPLSACAAQYDETEDTFHFFNETVTEGTRTRQSCEELEAKGVINKDFHYIITGDCNGNNNDTRQTMSDFDIIEKFLEDGGYSYEMRNPSSNPRVRERHNDVNAYCFNAKEEVRLYVYKDAEMVDKGLRMTSLVKNGRYVEDDSKEWQHVSTAVGYLICEAKQNNDIFISNYA